MTLFCGGGGAKANTFVNLFDKEGLKIKYVVDINTLKHGKHLAGTGHIIQRVDYMYKDLPKTIIIMNEQYEKEIRTLLEKMKIKTNIIAIENLIRQV